MGTSVVSKARIQTRRLSYFDNWSQSFAHSPATCYSFPTILQAESIATKKEPIMVLKTLLLTVLLTPLVIAQAPKPAGPTPTLKSVLLAQLRSTHNKAEWFVPVNTAVAGMTPEQAR